MEFMPVRDALRYFGIAYIPSDQPVPDEALMALEELMLEYDIDVEADNRGNLVAVNPQAAKEVLFQEHEKKVGYRPDNPGKMMQEKMRAAREEKAAEEERARAKERMRDHHEEKKNGGPGS